MGQNKLGARTSNHKISTELISYPNKLHIKPMGLGYGSQLSSREACEIGSLTLMSQYKVPSDDDLRCQN